MSPEWVLYDGRPIAEALVLSHEEQLVRLATAAPNAVPAAVVAGDPCYDRLAASVEIRDRYRAALGTDNRTLVVVSSTWSTNSLLGQRPQLIRTILSEFPHDSYQFAAILHPNASHGHGPAQIRQWLADCLRSGLVILPEIDGWRCGLLASDILIGDHGAVTGYHASLGKPTILGAFGDDDVAPGTAIAAMGATAPRLRPGPIVPQVEAAIQEHDPHLFATTADLVTSAPGQALVHLRALFYRLMNLPEPPVAPPIHAIPTGNPPHRPGWSAPHAFQVVASTEPDGTVHLTRFPAEPRLGMAREQDQTTHIVCSTDYPIRSLRAQAAVVTVRRRDVRGDVDGWLRATLARLPVCRIAAVLTAHRCEVRARDGRSLILRSSTAPPESLPSVLLEWSERDGEPLTAGSTRTLRLGAATHRVVVDGAGHDGSMPG